MIDLNKLPKQFVQDTVQREGVAGQKWLDQIPSIYQKYRQKWNLVANGPIMHGYTGIVIPVLKNKSNYLNKS